MSTESRRLGKYELRERLASGGQGEVWKAFDLQLHRFVAIKQLNAHLQGDSDSIERFEREAQIIASLRHPNIVQIHDFLQLQHTSNSNIPTAYIVMDYIEGPTLADYIRNTSRKMQFPPAADIVSIFTSISLALDYAHQKGMLHRDIKPANIMLDRRNPNGRSMGEPILMDFGIAKLQGGSADTTRVLGTPLYVSPEQALGLPSDKRSDLYSFGIILYEVMTGSPPFHGKPTLVILRMHLEGVPLPPALINPAISPTLSNVILKSIAKDPDARFSSASALTIALAEALNVPVPSELWKSLANTSSVPAIKPVVTNGSDTSNALSPPSELAPTLLTLSPQSQEMASPLAFVQPANNKQSPSMVPSDRGSAVYSPLDRNNLLPPSQIPSSLSPVTQPSGRRFQKKLSIAIIATVVVLILGLASYALFVPKTSSVSSLAVGQVHFLSSKKIVGDLNEVRITLQTIPDGKSYYAWLETHDFSVFPVHWSFSAQNGDLSPSFYTDPQHQNLLTSPPRPYLFLITKESGSPEVPSMTPQDRLYYALLPQTQSALHRYSVTDPVTFDILPCPQSDSSSNPCMS